MRSKGIADEAANGTGIGITLLLDNNNNNSSSDSDDPVVVWTARQYLRGSRSKYEAEYTALVMALRYAIRRLGLRHIRLALEEPLLLNQLTGVYPVLKDSLKPLYYQVQCMKEELEVGGSLTMEQDSPVASSSGSKQQQQQQPRITQCHALAEEALEMQTSFSSIDDDDQEEDDSYSKSSNNSKFIDTALSNDPMGKDYQGPPDSSSSEQAEVVALPVEMEDPEEAQTPPAPDQPPPPTSEATTEQLNGIDPSRTYKLMFDGGSRGNPGKAGAGMVLYDDTGQEIWCGGKFMPNCTNNQAEYTAILEGLHYARSLGIQRIQCHGDSQLVIRHLTGQYKVKSDLLRSLYEDTKAVLGEFQDFQLCHVKRVDNHRADVLANKAMDLRRSFNLNGEE